MGGRQLAVFPLSLLYSQSQTPATGDDPKSHCKIESIAGERRRRTAGIASTMLTRLLTWLTLCQELSSFLGRSRQFSALYSAWRAGSKIRTSPKIHKSARMACEIDSGVRKLRVCPIPACRVVG